MVTCSSGHKSTSDTCFVPNYGHERAPKSQFDQLATIWPFKFVGKLIEFNRDLLSVTTFSNGIAAMLGPKSNTPLHSFPFETSVFLDEVSGTMKRVRCNGLAVHECGPATLYQHINRNNSTTKHTCAPSLLACLWWMGRGISLPLEN